MIKKSDRFILPFIGALLIFCCIKHTLAEDQQTELPSSVLAQEWRVVRVTTKKEGGFDFRGTGFILVRSGKAFVVTNEHVIRNIKKKLGYEKDPWIIFNKKAYPVTVRITDEVNDFAILETKLKFEGVCQESIVSAKNGLKVFVIGYSKNTFMMNQPSILKASISFEAPYVRKEQLLITSGQYPSDTASAFILSQYVCEKGFSGSPIVDLNGNIIGYLHGSIDIGGCIGISIEKVINSLNRLTTH